MTTNRDGLIEKVKALLSKTVRLHRRGGARRYR